MRPKRRALLFAKRACIAATGALVLVLALSGWISLEGAWLGGNSAGCAGVGEGGAFIMDYAGPKHGHFDTRIVRRSWPNWAWWFQFQWGPPPGAPYSAHVLFVPLWAPILAGAGVAAVFWRLERAARRVEQGNCVRCGYDRQGLRSEAPCPECGATRIQPA